MRIPLVRTLSGRIILGFTVLTLTFGTISGFIVYNMEILDREILLIRTGYLPLALEAQELAEKQNNLWDYIFDELEAESDIERARRQIIKYTKDRSRALRNTEKVFAELASVAPYPPQIANTGRLISEIGSSMAGNARLYRLIRTMPPLASLEDSTDLSPRERNHYRKSKEALPALQSSEAQIQAQLSDLASQQTVQAKNTALALEMRERQLRLFAITMGLLAIFVGLLVTVWATMTLRPLQRLRDAARRIARGEYASRISEKGPAEVADLAREFNVMGRAIEERERELVRQERLAAVGKMAAMITHEVRNPLSAIGLNTELLEEELAELSGSDEARDLCHAITTEVDRLTAITEEYLQFARLPKPKRQLEQVNAIARSLADFQREPLALRGVELHCKLDDDLPAVLVDHAQLRQALLNLLRNASEAVVESGGGTITLSSRVLHGKDGDMVELAVTDTGPGVPEDIRPKLFDPFVSNKEGGTGLGLALTHQIIRGHGGEIHVESSPNRGAKFAIALPAEPVESH